MAQIKLDMKGQKRLFSGETDVSYATTHIDDKLDSFRSTSPDPISIHVPPYSPDEKENLRNQSHRKTSSIKSNTSSRHKPSPRKPSRRTHARETDGQLADEVSQLSMQDRRSFSDGSLHMSHPSISRAPANRVASLSTTGHPVAPSTLPPPAYPSSSLRAGANDDLNRFVSSSTASGTTLTAGSAPSFVKHAGPAHIRTIAPTDLPQIPDRLGDMLFDKVMMKWVKNTAQATQGGSDMGDYVPPDEVSEDPFGDIESLRDDSSRGRAIEVEYEVSERQVLPAEMSRIEEQSEIDDEEEMELTSFSTDDPSALIVDVMTGVDTIDDDETTDSDDVQDEEEAGTASDIIDYDSDDPSQQSVSTSSPPIEDAVPLPPPAADIATPARGRSLPMSATPVVRSALKGYTATPTSALKDPSRSKYHTPRHKKGHRRSVSFSDGKREGPIQGLAESPDPEGHATDTLASTGIVQSARSKRIAQMMDALEDGTWTPCRFYLIQ